MDGSDREVFWTCACEQGVVGVALVKGIHVVLVGVGFYLEDSWWVEGQARREPLLSRFADRGLPEAYISGRCLPCCLPAPSYD